MLYSIPHYINENNLTVQSFEFGAVTRLIQTGTIKLEARQVKKKVIMIKSCERSIKLFTTA